jgi:hypothetical protein
MQQPSLLQIFAKVSDPRVNRCKKHNLLDIIILSILGVLCGADTYGEIEMFGKANLAFLKQLLSLTNGIPSHDTINRVFQAINPRQLERCLAEWSNSLKNNNTASLQRVKSTTKQKFLQGCI